MKHQIKLLLLCFIQVDPTYYACDGHHYLDDVEYFVTRLID